MKSSRAVFKKHKYIRKRIERVGIDPKSLINQTIDYDIKGQTSLIRRPQLQRNPPQLTNRLYAEQKYHQSRSAPQLRRPRRPLENRAGRLLINPGVQHLPQSEQPPDLRQNPVSLGSPRTARPRRTHDQRRRVHRAW